MSLYHYMTFPLVTTCLLFCL